MDLTIFLAATIAAAPPVLFAVLGETVTERAGMINLSLDGSLLLSAMTAFATATSTGSLLLGFAAGAAVGAAAAAAVAVSGLTLRQSQVATGFVLALLCRDLAYVLGNRFSHVPGPQVPHWPVPGLCRVPWFGPILFNHNAIVYLSILAVFAVWVVMFRARPGLILRGLGERPQAVFARGKPVLVWQYLSVIAGGALTGIGGAASSLLVKPGWSRPYGIEGSGWIALAIVIFGNWHPLRAAVGAIVFVGLQTLATTLQSLLPGVPTLLFPTLPFPLMIFTLLLVTAGTAGWVNRVLSKMPPPVRRALQRLINALQTRPPGALGTVMKRD